MAKYFSFPMDITVMGMTTLSNTSQRELLSRGAAAGFPSSAKTLQAPIKFWWPHSLCCHHTASLVGHMTSNCPELKMLFNDCIVYAPDSHIIWVRLGSFHGNNTWHQEIKHKTDLKRGSQAVAHWQSGGTPALVTAMREENRDKIIPYEMVSSCHIFRATSLVMSSWATATQPVPLYNQQLQTCNRQWRQHCSKPRRNQWGLTALLCQIQTSQKQALICRCKC